MALILPTGLCIRQGCKFNGVRGVIILASVTSIILVKTGPVKEYMKLTKFDIYQK
jgi:hypothetical protein